MSKFAFIVAAMLAVSATSALAQDKMIVDMKKMTCAQLTKLGFQDFAGVTMWLSGYYNASVRNTVVDLARVRAGGIESEDLLPDKPARHRHVGGRTHARHQDAAIRRKRQAGAPPTGRCATIPKVPASRRYNQILQVCQNYP